jgi:putative acetyltransferase
VSQELSIRDARASDRRSILATVRAAFAGEGHDEQEEIDIVETVWSLRAGVEGLDLVAVRHEEVIGHVLGSWGDLSGRPVVGVAPLAVLPFEQRTGVGGALMREIVRRGDLARLPLLLLLGDPGYYERFGFEPAGSFGVWYPPAGRDSPHFMVRRSAAFSECPGEYRYAWEL